MDNSISLSVRMPISLNERLTSLSKNLGLTKISLLRIAVWEFLDAHPCTLPTVESEEATYRFSFPVNSKTHEILRLATENGGKSLNSVITSVAILALERYAKYI